MCFLLHGDYLMETAPFPGNSAGKQRYRGDFITKDRSLGKQNLRRTTHLCPHSLVPCFIHIRGEPGKLELKKHWRLCLLLFFPPQRWLPGSMRRTALPRMIAGRIQAICRPNCRSTRLSKQRSWPIEIAWTPSNLWEKQGWWQGWATGMKDSADSLSFSDLKQARGNHCPLTDIVHIVSEGTGKLILLVHQELSVSIGFFQLLSYCLVWACYLYSLCMQWKEMGAFNERFNPLTLGTSLWGECHIGGTPVSFQQGT